MQWFGEHLQSVFIGNDWSSIYLIYVYNFVYRNSVLFKLNAVNLRGEIVLNWATNGCEQNRHDSVRRRRRFTYDQFKSRFDLSI